MSALLLSGSKRMIGMRMSEILWRVGRLNPGEYWIEDLTTHVQVGWISSNKGDGRWYLFDASYEMRAGPFRTIKEAEKHIDTKLADEFGFARDPESV